MEPEIEGTQLDMEKVNMAIHEAMKSQAAVLDLEEERCYIEPAARADDHGLQECITQANKCLETRITYDWNDNEVILDEEQIKDWVSIEGQKVILDEKAVETFVKANAKKFDTYGKEKTFRTTLGFDLILERKSYGWLTDRETETKELIELIKKGAVENREPVYTVKARWKGTNDIGNTYVEADMSNQHLYLYQKGELMLESDFVSGNISLGGGYITPEGIFGLTYKTTDAVLRGRDYVTPVNYWMPFYGNYGMHDATWRNEFGGNIYLTDGSHGCLNLPLDKAAEIYTYMTEGFPIICYYYPEEIVAGMRAEAPAVAEDEEE